MAHGEFPEQLTFFSREHESKRTVCCASFIGNATKLEVSNEGKFVILVVDGLSGLEVGMQTKQTQEVISGELRLALGGILIDKDKLIVQVL